MADHPASIEAGCDPNLENKAPQPQGVMRRNLKMQIYLGVAVLFIIATAVSSLHHRPSSVKSSQPGEPPAPLVQEAPDTNIEEVRKSIEKQQKEARQPQGPDAGAGIPAPPYGQEMANAAYSPQPSGAYGYNSQSQLTPQQQQQTELQQQERTLAYKARFASNLAYSQSKENFQPANPAASNAPGEPDLLQQANAYSVEPGPNGQQSRLTASSLVQRHAPAQPGSNGQANAQARPLEVMVNSAVGQPYVVYEGTIIETALMNGLDGDASGPVKVLVTNPVYSHDHQHVLIPDGTVVLGDSHKIGGAGFGQQRRLAVAFHRMIMPDGYSVDLDQFQGLNQSGETGLHDQVNNHYLQIFGASIALGMIAGAAEISNPGGVYTGSGEDAFKYGVAANVSQSSTTILDRFLNIPPTITIREGHRVKVYISQDLLLPAYENHRIPSTY